MHDILYKIGMYVSVLVLLGPKKRYLAGEVRRRRVVGHGNPS